jgi:hypothetical protein
MTNARNLESPVETVLQSRRVLAWLRPDMHFKMLKRQNVSDPEVGDPKLAYVSCFTLLNSPFCNLVAILRDRND